MIAVIARREATSLFRTPFAWVLLAVVQFVLGYQFLAQIEFYTAFATQLRKMPEAPGVTEIVVTPLFGLAALVLLFVVPVVTMASISGERRGGTLALLYSAPVTAWQIVAGKFLGICALLGVIWVLLALMPWTLAWGAAIDPGLYASGLAALALLMCAYAAIGLMFSAFVVQPAAAAALSFGACAGLWLVDWAARLGQDGGVLTSVSSQHHFQRLAGGLVDTRDCAYFLILTLTALAVTAWRLDGERRAG